MIGILLRTSLVVVLLACVSTALAGTSVQVQDSGVEVRLRGISAVDANIAWASGQKGTVLRTVDAGAQWQAMHVDGADALDFRDVEGFSADVAVVLSIGPGEASRVYRTQDGGQSWTLALQNTDPRGFFDCMAFEGERGWMLGDPVDGRYQVFTTDNGGRDWRQLVNGPQADTDEAAFAASGNCIARLHGVLAVASGGARARIHLLHDGQQAWQAVDTGMARRKPEAGVFSVAALAEGWFAVGGDYRGEATPGNATISTGKAVHRIIAPRGYRSGAACVGDKLPCIATGPSGTDLWDGMRWHALGDAGFDAIDLHGNIGWLSGDAGRIARIVVDRE
ncbi:MAG: WD40/YVTN/BNR-like repeat-containing protein [Thermomonas sp.]